MRSEGVVGSVCLSVKSHLTRLFVLKTLSRTHRATKVKKNCGIFSENASLRRYSTPSVVWPYKRPLFTYVRNTYEHGLEEVCARFTLVSRAPLIWWGEQNVTK